MAGVSAAGPKSAKQAALKRSRSLRLIFFHDTSYKFFARTSTSFGFGVIPLPVWIATSSRRIVFGETPTSAAMAGTESWMRFLSSWVVRF